MQVIKAPARPKSRNLVFTCAGDHSKVQHWLRGPRDFDLWVVYCGAKTIHPHEEDARFYARSCGTKYQNLYWAYLLYARVIERYEAVIVLDDDILIEAGGLTRLFEIRQAHDLCVVQPAFQHGKADSGAKRAAPTQLRYTNIIDMTCPLFRRDILDVFMSDFDPNLSGYGEDWWFLHLLGPDLLARIAIADEVSCTHSHAQRTPVWERIRLAQRVDDSRTPMKYSPINNAGWETAKALARYIPEWAGCNARRLVRNLRR